MQRQSFTHCLQYRPRQFRIEWLRKRREKRERHEKRRCNVPRHPVHFLRGQDKLWMSGRSEGRLSHRERIITLVKVVVAKALATACDDARREFSVVCGAPV